MISVNGGLRELLAAIRQEREDNRLAKEERARERKEIAKQTREANRANRREEREKCLRFRERVKFCGCGFSRAFRMRRNHGV